MVIEIARIADIKGGVSPISNWHREELDMLLALAKLIFNPSSSVIDPSAMAPLNRIRNRNSPSVPSGAQAKAFPQAR